MTGNELANKVLTAQFAMASADLLMQNLELVIKALRAYDSARPEALPREPTPEMCKAFWLAFGADGAKMLEKVCLVGSGNGDLQMVERWVNASIIFHLADAWRAMLEAARSPQLRSQEKP